MLENVRVKKYGIKNQKRPFWNEIGEFRCDFFIIDLIFSQYVSLDAENVQKMRNINFPAGFATNSNSLIKPVSSMVEFKSKEMGEQTSCKSKGSIGKFRSSDE